ncbi:hypothetical protein [Streptomyces sp. B1I3]|uniref:hypothetical protein n=1 Tax=Streptomyces sp. B1I3 TaxID=3042264 RepID=UPI002789E751|nr:hypothetical protein [Streptomyces sp. B1I3]MDQ0795589.1 hypothetical protein [Streptomyces sp. B1I3]
MALTNYRWTATGTTPNGEAAEGAGNVQAESVREAEAMVIGHCGGKGFKPDDIVLILTRS